MAANGDNSGHGGTCGATTSAGTPCQQPAGFGTDHVGYGRCKWHTGSTRTGQRHAQNAQAKEAVATYGLPIDIAPEEALLQELRRTAGHVAWLGMMVAQLTGKQAVAGGAFGSPSAYLTLYQQERKHLADVAKTCLVVGIEERRVRVIEHIGLAIAAPALQALRASCAVLGVELTDEAQAEFARVIEQGLSAAQDSEQPQLAADTP